MKKRILPFILAGALTAAFAAPAGATMHEPPACDISQLEDVRGGNAALAALIAAVVDANVNVGICTIDVDILNNSLNNLLQNADIDILNNSLNNLLRNADVDVTVIDGDVVVNVLSIGGNDFTIVFV